MASTSKKTSKKLSGLAVAMGLGVAVATGHGVAGADPSDPGTPSAGAADSGSSPSDPASGAHPKAAEHVDSAEPSATKPTHSADPTTKPTPARETSEAVVESEPDVPSTETPRQPAEPPTVPPSTAPEVITPTPTPTPEPPPTPEPTAAAEPVLARQDDSDGGHGAKGAAPGATTTTTSAVTAESEFTSSAAALTAGKRVVTPSASFAATNTSPTTQSQPQALTVSPLVTPEPDPPLVSVPKSIVMGLLALVGISPSALAPTGPLAPIGSLLELAWAALRRIDYELFNQAPTAVPTPNPQSSTGVITGSVGATDREGDALSYSVTDTPEHGTVVVNSDGTFTYTPDAAWAQNTAGPDDFVITVSDTGRLHQLLFPGLHSTAVTINVTVTPTNHAPTITVTPSSTDPSDGSVTYTVATADLDGDPRTVTTSTPTHGSLVDNHDGTYTYTPDPAYAHELSAGGSTVPGTDSMTFTVSDGKGGSTSKTATVSIAPTNANPTISASPGVTNPDGSITYTVTTTDPDNDLRIYNVTTPPAHGVLVFNGDSAYTYTRSTLDADSFTLTVIDEHGGTATATVDIAARVNDDPTITVTPGTRNTTNGSIKYTVTTTDPDGDAVTVTFTDPAHGSVVANGDGTFTYTPDRAYAHSLGVGGSEPDPFTFTATDAWGATATEDASPLLKFLNQRPIMAINLTNEDPITGVITGQVTLSDPDGDPVIYQLHRLQRQGVVKDKGTLEFNETTGVFTFTPNAAARAAAVAPDAGFFDQTVTLEIAVTDGPAVINTGISLTIYPPTI